MSHVGTNGSRSEKTRRHLRLGVFLAAGFLLFGGALAASQWSPVRGDLNCDGEISIGDLAPFTVAVNDPHAWCEQYGRNLGYLLGVSDFNGDGELDLDDIPGFSEVLLASLPAPPIGGLGTTGSGIPDLDIDSNNDNGSDPPDRSDDEDVIEDDPFLPGKLIVVENQVKSVLEFDASGATPLSDLYFRLIFPDNLTLEIPPYDPIAGPPEIDPDDPVSGEAMEYPYGGTTRLGDMDGNGTVNSYDLDPFILALTNPEAYRIAYDLDPDLVGDINGDWVLDTYDVDPFVALLVSGAQNPIPVRLLVEGQSVSPAQGETRIVAQADCDGDETFEDTETDAVRATVWDGDDLPPPGELGTPRAWGSGLPVSPFSTVNLRNGNLLTAIPLVTFDPVGPAVSFTLYHNSLGAEYETDYSAWGFDLGDGWSVSYGSYIEGTNGDETVAVVGADGSRNVFTWDGSDYGAPAGVHDTLVWSEEEPSKWTLTSPGQTQAVYNDDGYLIEIYDSAGNVSTIGRDAGNDDRIDYVKSAADDYGEQSPVVGKHRLEFSYVSGRLDTITDPIGREWTFEYANGRLWKIGYPHDNYVDESWVVIAYESSESNRIEEVTSRDSKTWTYTYTSGLLTLVEDPEHEVDEETTVRYEQAFEYEDTLSVDDLWETTYTDRRENDWVIGFDTLGNACEATNPLEDTNSWEHDADHNVVEFTDELNHTWTAEYGPVGNVEEVASPITNQTWTYDWLEPGQNDPPNLYRLEKVTDPLSHWVEYYYEDEDANDPTLVTKIRQQEASTGAGHTDTTLEYYGTEDAHATGQLKEVVDANDVHHLFEYDNWGYFEQGTEGLAGEGDGRYVWVNPVVTGPLTCNPLGWFIHVCIPNSCCGVITLSANLLPVLCWIECPESLAPPFERLGYVNHSELPDIGPLMQCFDDVDYDVVGRLESLDRCNPWGQGGSFRTHDPEYDDLGRLESYTVQAGMLDMYQDWQVDRVFDYQAYDPDGRPLTIEGPDGQTVTYTVSGQPGYDELGRPKTVTRSGLSATFTYDDASRVTRIDYGNDAYILRQYDDADRLEWIKHYDDTNTLRMQISYTWNLDNTVDTRTEYDASGQTPTTAVLTFWYDNRQRLRRERRVVDGSTTVYDITYTYDQLGNRVEKLDSAADVKTCYIYDTDWDPVGKCWREGLCFAPDYDLDDVGEYETRNNRLLEYREYADDGQGGWDELRRVRYVYYETGHAANITIKDVGDDFYYDLALYYTSDGKLWRALWDEWKVSGEQITNYDTIKAREFFYDGPRQRYLSREVDPDTWEPVDPEEWTPEDEPWLWTDYNGPLPHGDFELTFDEQTAEPITDETMRYLAGAGIQAQQTLDGGQPDETSYLHGDLIDSTMLTTDENGDADQTLAYTAFGEPIGDAALLGTRYQYAGGWGYESDLLTLEGANPALPTVTLQHVGWRWYQPSIGRFVQRDPIGLRGGLNLYHYVDAKPVASVDPTGLTNDWSIGPLPPGWKRAPSPWSAPKRLGPPRQDKQGKSLINEHVDLWEDLWRWWSGSKPVRQAWHEGKVIISPSNSGWGAARLFFARLTWCLWLLQIEGDDYQPDMPLIFDPETGELIYP